MQIIMYKEYIEIEGREDQVRIICIPSTITTAITEPPRVGSKAIPATPEHHVVGAGDLTADSGLTYAEKFETGK
jgi:hypothetical protein